jgi:effector-binding domain-containing protein
MKTKKALAVRKAKSKAPAPRKAAKAPTLPPAVDAKAVFARMVGDWEGTAKTWFEPGKAAEESAMTASIRAGAGGLVAVMDSRGTVTGSESLGTTLFGYDTARRLFAMAWADSFHMSPNVMWSEGPGDADGNSFAVLGSWAAGAERWGWRVRVAISGPDDLGIRHFIITPKGEESLAIDIAYRRKAPPLAAPEPEMAAEQKAGVEEKRLTARRFVGIRRRVAPAAMGAALGEILPDVANFLKSRGIAPVSMPATMYVAHDAKAGDFEILGGFFIGKSLRTGGKYEVIEIPASDAAVATHLGPYQKLGETHGAAHAWIVAQGRVATMPCWEVYLNDPGQVAPAELRTEVVLPMK